MVKNTVYAAASDEVFLNGEGQYFDRNRLYGGLGYVINKNFRFELGYMQQKLLTTERNQFQIIFFNNLSFMND